MDDNKNIKLDDKLIQAGRGIPKDSVEQNNDPLAGQGSADIPDNLDERFRKAGA